MDKGGGLGSMVKGMGGKLNKLKEMKDKASELSNKATELSNKIENKSSELTEKAGDFISDKVSNVTDKVDKVSEKAKNLESSVKDKLDLGGKRTEAQNKFSEVVENMKKYDEKKADTQAKGRISRELLGNRSLAKNVGIFGPTTYKYLIYVILFLNICSITLLTFNKSIFYKYQGNVEVYVRLNKNVFYIYIFTLFLLILQLYTLKEPDNYKEIVADRGKYQIYVEIFNILCTIGLTYYIYTQIDFIHTDCPEPNKRLCVANKNGPNEIRSCSEGPFQCGKIEETEYGCRRVNCDNDIASNFYLVPSIPPDPIYTCENYNGGNCPDGEVLKNEPENQICKDSECTVDECCASPSEQSAEMTAERLKKMIVDNFNILIKDDESRIKTLEERVKNLSPGEGIPGPPGPPGPPGTMGITGATGATGATGTPGSDARPPVPPSNQFENILCPNEPGGICKDGETRCNDQGMCEGFALISLRDKIDLKLKYKDLNNNAYKANNLMNNLETFLLNTLK
jgi:hypothetical protein